MVHDLDELILKCRDDRARAYIGEAVACYRAGAYRAAIVSTWIAVAYDIIDKIRELSLAGDKAAEKLSEKFELIRKSNNVAEALAFERKLLDVARDEFELLSPVEYVDLSRIQDDRHRCAHPSHTADAEIFSPSPELARLHIRTAIEALLMHEPAQGRAALDGLLKEIQSPYFPLGEEDALKILGKGPLRRARQSLVRNFMMVLLKSMLGREGAGDFRQFFRDQAALYCVKQLHLDIWRRTLASEASRLFRGVADDRLLNCCRTAMVDLEMWNYLDDGQQSRIRAFVRELPTSEISHIEELLTYPPIANEASLRARRMSIGDFEKAFFLALPRESAERLIEAYGAAGSFDEANRWGRVIQSFASSLNRMHVVKLIHAAGRNGQVRGSFQLRATVAALRKVEDIPEESFNTMLRENGLSELAVEEGPE